MVVIRHDEAAPVPLVSFVDGLLQLGRDFQRLALLQFGSDLDPAVRACDALQHLVDDRIGVDDPAGSAQVDREAVVDDGNGRGSSRHAELTRLCEHGAGYGPFHPVPALGEPAGLPTAPSTSLPTRLHPTRRLQIAAP